MKKVSKITISPLLLMSCIFCIHFQPTEAQTILYSSVGGETVVDFNDNLAAGAATLSWNQGTTFNGVYAQYDDPTAPDWTNPPVEYRRTNGRAAGIRLFQWRTSPSATDGALGTWPINGTGDIHYGIRLVNDTGFVLDEFSVGYTGQQWFSHDSSDTSITVFYQTGEHASDLTGGTWTQINDLTFTSPISNADNAVLNGTLADNSHVFTPQTITGMNWEDGEELWIRFTFENIQQESQGLAIDDFTFTAVPEPSHYAALAGLLALFLCYYRRKKQ